MADLQDIFFTTSANDVTVSIFNINFYVRTLSPDLCTQVLFNDSSSNSFT